MEHLKFSVRTFHLFRPFKIALNSSLGKMNILIILLSVAFVASKVDCRERFNVGEIKSTWKALHHQDGPGEDGIFHVLEVMCHGHL